MTEDLVPTKDLQLVALTPAELPATQAQLADWCLGKMRDLGKEYRELSANLAVAKRNRWSRGGLISAVSRTKRTIQYYRKMRIAVQAGYLIVPNFPVEVIAVRVNRAHPPYNEGRYASSVNEMKPQLLPPGEGRYVDEISEVHQLSPVKDAQGNTVPRVEAGYYRDVDFPVTLVKPQIMLATERAMAMRLFDRIGIANHSGRTNSARQRRADPIVLGQLIDPRSRGTYSEKVVSFFIAWWLDTSVL